MNELRPSRFRAVLGGYRKAASAISALSATTFLTALFAFFTQVILAHGLQPTAYGALATALTTITLLSPLAGFGVGKYWLRAFGLEGWKAKRWVRASLVLVVLSSVLAALLLLLWIQVSGVDASIQRTTLILLPTLFVYPLSEMAYARFQLEERYGALAFWQTTPNLTRIVIAVVTLFMGAGLYQVALGFSLGLSLIAGCFLVIVLGIIRDRLRLVGHGKRPPRTADYNSTVAEVVYQSWPFALAGIFYLVYFQSDILLLGWLDGPAAAGIYNVAFAVMAAVFLLPSVVHQQYLLPKMHRWAEHDRKRFLSVYRFGNGVTLLLGVVVMVALLCSVTWAVPLVFGEPYRAAGRVLLILALAVPGRYLATSIGGVLVTQTNMRRKVWLMGTSAAVNLGLNLLLIPQYGIYGAAWATVASEFVLMAAYLFAAQRYVFGPDALRGWTLKIK